MSDAAIPARAARLASGSPARPLDAGAARVTAATGARRDQIGLVLAALLLGGVWVAVILASSDGHLSAPLDDTFIHLQYARQIAAGHFFAYNTADGYSSGATSFLYAIVLAVFAWLGADGDALLWATHAFNIVLFAASVVLVYRLGRRWRDRLTGLAAGVLFLLNGPIVWGYASGMEIGLFAVLLLAALLVLDEWSLVTGQWSVTIQNPKSFQFKTQNSKLITTVLLAAFALMRPEAAIMAWEAAALLAWHAWRRPGPDRWGWVAAVTVAAVVGLLPLALDWWYTGRVSPNAAEFKLILYRYPAIHPLHVAYIWARFFTLMISDTFLQDRPDAPFFVYSFLLGALGGFGRAVAEIRRRTPGVFTIAAAWLLTNWALTATLQPAQQNRYLIAGYPLFTLFMVLGLGDVAGALGRLRGGRRARERARAVFLGLTSVVVATSIGGLAGMLATLGENAGDIYRQQIATGHWIADHLPADARIAINDAGAMKFYSGRYMYDLIGLTTDGLAGLDHAGPGALVDWLTALPPAQRPGYFAIYANWFPDLVALPGFLTPLHGQHLLNNTVTGGADLIVYQAHWDALRRADRPVLDHTADQGETPAGKVVFPGGTGAGPFYLARLQAPAAGPVRFQVDLAAGAQVQALDLVEDASGWTAHLAGAGPHTLALPAGSYRLNATGRLPPGAGITVRLLTPGLLWDLPAHSPAPPRRLVDQVDIGNLASEAAHAYQLDTWQWNIYASPVLSAATYPAAPGPPILDSGRSIPGWQQMDVTTTPGRPLKLVLRYLSTAPQRLHVTVDGADAGLWYVPAATGWGEAELLLPAARIRHARTRIRLTLLPDAANTPMNSFYCWVYQ